MHKGGAAVGQGSCDVWQPLVCGNARRSQATVAGERGVGIAKLQRALHRQRQQGVASIAGCGSDRGACQAHDGRCTRSLCSHSKLDMLLVSCKCEIR